MGREYVVRFPGGSDPSWEAIRDRLAGSGEPVTLRMIDGLPAFPDESPPPDWRELRLGGAAGMVTVRREPGRLTCVIWGTDDPGLQRFWERVTWACAEASAGTVDTPAGSLSASEFAQRMLLTLL